GARAVAHRRQRRQHPLRRSRPRHRRPDLDARRGDSGDGRRGARGEDAGPAAGRPHLHRRRRHLDGGFPRGAEPRGGPRRAVRPDRRAQRLRLFDPHFAADEDQAHRRPRRRLRHPGRDGGRERRPRGLRGDEEGRRAGARRGRADAHRGEDFPDERPRRARRRGLRAARAVRRVAEERSDRPLRAPSAGPWPRDAGRSAKNRRRDRPRPRRRGRFRARLADAAARARARRGLRARSGGRSWDDPARCTARERSHAERGRCPMSATTSQTYLEAIRQGMWDEMEQDEQVFLLGQDVGTYGGAFRVTAGFLDHFGPKRVIDTPISESGMVGAAIGASMLGLRPIVEMQFIDFISCAYNQIINFAATCRYRWGQSVPIVIRGPSGGNVHGSAFHSQNPESYFQHTPGLKIVAPSSAVDAKGLIRAAIRDPNPVLFFEHKYLYRRIKEDVPGGDWIVPIGKARLARTGRDLSIVTYGAMLHVALDAAARLESEGIEIEVLDLRTIKPLDQEAILATAKKTSRVLVLTEEQTTGSVAGEVAARIGELAFGFLDAPVTRF